MGLGLHHQHPARARRLAILWRCVDESRDETAARRVDVPGATVATLGLGALVYGLIAAQGGRFGALALGTIAIGAKALGIFVALEARVARPMVRLDYFRNRRFAAANLYTLLLYAALGGSLFFVPFDLINVRRYPAVPIALDRSFRRVPSSR